MLDKIKNPGEFAIFGIRCSGGNINWETGEEMPFGESYQVDSIYIWMMLPDGKQYGFNVDVNHDGRITVPFSFGFVFNVFIVQHFARHLSTMTEEGYPRDRLFLAEDGMY